MAKTGSSWADSFANAERNDLKILKALHSETSDLVISTRSNLPVESLQLADLERLMASQKVGGMTGRWTVHA